MSHQTYKVNDAFLIFPAPPPQQIPQNSSVINCTVRINFTIGKGWQLPFTGS